MQASTYAWTCAHTHTYTYIICGLRCRCIYIPSPLMLSMGLVPRHPSVNMAVLQSCNPCFQDQGINTCGQQPSFHISTQLKRQETAGHNIKQLPSPVALEGSVSAPPHKPALSIEEVLTNTATWKPLLGTCHSLKEQLVLWPLIIVQKWKMLASKTKCLPTHST